jgi:signal transduction histidine kinase/CheY-like chemotaxis protein
MGSEARQKGADSGEVAVPVVSGLGGWLRAWFTLPREPWLREEHQRMVLHRTQVAALIAVVVMPFTILTDALVHRPDARVQMLAVSVAADALALALWFALRARRFDRLPYLPFFLLVVGICYPTESYVLQLTGGGAESHFIYPYFVVLFGLATLFPAHAAWAAAAIAAAPVSYWVSELAASGSLAPGRPTSQLILLIDSAFIAFFASRVTTRLFFREAEHRFALERANVQLRELDRAKGEFFAGLSHDLRSPLTVILGPLSALQEEAEGLGPHGRRYLELAMGGAARLDAMINDLLELARIDAGVGELKRADVDVGRLVADLVESNRLYAEGLGLRLVLEAPAEPVRAAVDPDKLERVVMNLLSNACKFSSKGTSIRVRLEDAGAALLLQVADQGMGIPAEDLPRIFARFARGAHQDLRRTRGAGVGLAVVKDFVELHGGSVAVQSALNVGTTFTVRLPRVALPEAPAAAPALVPVLRSRPPNGLLLPAATLPLPTPAGPRPRLLLVEDSIEVRAFLDAQLSAGFEVLAAATAEDGLARLARGPVDLVLTDVMLPDMDGLELTRRLRAGHATARLPILIFSARGSVQTRLDAFAAGADDFVNKPFDPRELQARLHALLRRGAPPLASSAPRLSEEGP